MRERFQRAFREILVIGIVLAVVIRIIATNMEGFSGLLVAFLTGLMFALPAWGVYRFGRFVITR